MAHRLQPVSSPGLHLVGHGGHHRLGHFGHRPKARRMPAPPANSDASSPSISFTTSILTVSASPLSNLYDLRGNPHQFKLSQHAIPLICLAFTLTWRCCCCCCCCCCCR